MIETHLPCSLGIEGAVGIEVSSPNVQAEPFHRLEGILQVCFEVKGVVVISCHKTSRGDDVAFAISDGQDVGGLGFLAPLIGHRFTPLLGNGMTAIQIQFR